MTLPAMNPVSLQVDALHRAFHERYGHAARIFRAPGRVNLIGEHTDYNDGFVMPAAIDFSTWVAASPRRDRVLRAWSRQYQEAWEISLDAVSGPPSGHWSDYVRGIAAVLQSAGVKLGGANLLIDGQVPVGAGLSSSAALELSVGLALAGVSGIEVPRLDLVKFSQRAENEYAGAMCGIMDQFIAGFGHAGNALMLDCRSLEFQLLPISGDVRLVICNSMVKHDLAAGEYNTRREECAEAVAALQTEHPEVRALRDATLPMLDAGRDRVSDVVYRRARHVITEDDRVLQAASALREHRLADVGRLMFESHRSLRDDYEVSAPELDLLVELAAKHPKLIGARMTGGGFGGCTVNLVHADGVDSFRQEVASEYERATGRKPDVFVCTPAEGAQEIIVEGTH
jgi:galactokinase